MKKLILAAFFVIAIGGTATAQQKFSATEFNKNLGKTGTLCDTIYSLHIFSDTPYFIKYGWRLS